MDKITEKMNDTHSTSYDKPIRTLAERFNSVPGGLEGYDCPKCLNRGNIMVEKDGYEDLVDCSCRLLRKNKTLMERSGLKKLLEIYTLENFSSNSEHHKTMKSTAERYIDQPDGKWLVMVGNPGTGKTHICTAVVNELMQKGYPAKYMEWREVITDLKTKANTPEYTDILFQFKRVPLLYIDDLFKTSKKSEPSASDIAIAYELINYRYNNKLMTIVSSELTITRLMEIDEAIASRMIEMSKDFLISIKYDASRNYRINPA